MVQHSFCNLNAVRSILHINEKGGKFGGTMDYFFNPIDGWAGMKVGINSRMIKEISNGPVLAKEVDMIELGINDSKVLNGEIDYDRLYEIASLHTNFSIHAPYTNNRIEDINVDLGIRNEQNFKVMENVFKIASFLNAKYVVVHGDKVNGDFRKSFLNVISNLIDLSKMASEYSVTLLLENLHKENGYDRFGILPQEVLQIIESAKADNLKVAFDIGHANLAANLYKFDILKFFDYLSPYIHHIHIHDNMGIPAVVNTQYGDQHLPLSQGNIDFNRIFERINKTKVENLVLELKTKSREDAMRSIKMLMDFRDVRKKFTS